MASKTDGYKEAKAEHRRGRRKLHHVEIRKAANDGHVVEHHYESDGMTYHKPDVYAFAGGPEMVKHIMDAHGVKEAEMVAHLKGDNEAEPGGADEEHQGEEEDGEE